MDDPFSREAIYDAAMENWRNSRAQRQGTSPAIAALPAIEVRRVDTGSLLTVSRSQADVQPLDPSADSTFDAWMQADDGRTIEEFARDGGRPIAR